MNKKKNPFGNITEEISQNLQSPELAPSDRRITGRTKQLNLKVTEEFYWKLKNIALAEQCLLVEVIEKSLAEYERKKNKNSPSN